MNDGNTYGRAGVDLENAQLALDSISDAVRSTYDERVLAGLGAFGGLFALPELPKAPVLVASTDGVGTKTKVATALGRLRGLGEDLVNHCVNDILVQGATPLFFLDYVAAARLQPRQVAEVVGGMAAACRSARMPLLGGETAEMPGVYVDGELDLVGTIVGLVARESIVDGSRVGPGDKILALASSGLHTNGYSLARKVLDGSYDERLGDVSVGEALLAPHRSYLAAVTPLLEVPGLVHGMVHVTGGGIPGNLPRTLPPGCGARIEPGSWPVPPLFELIARRGRVDPNEMHRVFNMGAGFLVITAAQDVERTRSLCPEALWEIGTVTDEPGAVLLQ